MSPAAKRKIARDTVLEGAVEAARAAAIEAADRESDVGEHLGCVVSEDRLVTHYFGCELKGYGGWRWAVVVARAPRARTATVCEVVLLPGEQALLAPGWLPWADRLRPGDIGPGDVLPFKADDPRLEPGFTATGDEEIDAVAIEELALERARILSKTGRDEAAQRWYDSDRGAATPIAVLSSAPCGECGFLVPLQGALGQVFGVCANQWAPDDGRVVSFDHGCGAHSETDAPQRPSSWPADRPVIDDLTIEVESTTVANEVAVEQED
ncbi:Protein of unknown function [Micrococcales bacterium KH10]|nr:Protein of unknown function [Micrococcales bacterium KH10]